MPHILTHSSVVRCRPETWIRSPEVAPAPASASRQRIGEMLVERGFITEEMVDVALRVQKLTGARLGEVLVASGHLSQSALNAVLSEQLRVPTINLESVLADEDARELVSAEYAESRRAAPFALSNQQLSVAFADPTEQAVLDFEFFTGMRVKPYLASAADIKRFTFRLHNPSLWARAHGQFAGDSERSQVGERLIEKGYLTRPALNAALVVQAQTGLRLASILSASGQLSEAGQADVLRVTMALPMLSLSRVRVDSEAVRSCPSEVSDEFGFAPFLMCGGVLHIACKELPSEQKLVTIEGRLKVWVKAFLASPWDVARYQGEARERENPGQAVQAESALSSRQVQVLANAAASRTPAPANGRVVRRGHRSHHYRNLRTHYERELSK